MTRWQITGGGTISDSQGNVYKQFRQSDTYRSHRRGYSTTATQSGVLTVSFSVPQEEIIIFSSPGYLSTVDQTVVYPPSGSMNLAVCPPVALSITTASDSMLISDWALDGGTASSCKALSGTSVLAPICGGSTGQVNYEVAAAGVHTQQFTFSPGFNAGNGNCGLTSFRAAVAPPPPPPPPPPPTGCLITPGDGLVALCETDKPEILAINRSVWPYPDWPYMSELILGPVTQVPVTANMHQIRPPCGISGVVAYDNQKPRNAIQVGWTVDPDTCDVMIKFAVPQTNFYVVVR
jgi:hypothetical protein